MTNVLVVFATKHGSTQQVAEAIAATVREHGDTARVLRAPSRRESLRDWDLVILGGPLYSGRWHRDARKFLKQHRGDLADTPIAVFAMGPRTDDPAAWQRSRAQLDRALAERDWLTPLAATVFGGVDPTAHRDRPLRDIRNWDAIQQWATQVSSALATSGRPESELR